MLNRNRYVFFKYIRSFSESLVSGHVDHKSISTTSALKTTLLSDRLKMVDSQNHPLLREEPDREEKFLAKINDTSRLKPHEVLRKMSEFLKKDDLKSALELYDVKMKEECVRPNFKHYRLLIHGCAKRGYVTKAFHLYREYTSRCIGSNQGIISDLFTTCANSPLPYRSYALERAKHLQRHLEVKHGNRKFSMIVHNSMIRAFGTCGDLASAFAIFDRLLLERENEVQIDTYTNLLCCCLSDKNAGFRHTVILLRKLIENQKKKFGNSSAKCLDILKHPVLLNLLLKITRECGGGEDNFLQDIMLEAMSVKDAQKYLASKNAIVSVSPSVNTSKVSELPHLLQVSPRFNNVSHMKPLSDHRDRFQLLGGLDVFLNTFVKRSTAVNEKIKLNGKKSLKLVGKDRKEISVHQKPDVKVFTQLLRLVDLTPENVNKILDSMKECEVTPDIAFFNVLIHHRSINFDYEGAYNTIELVHEYGLTLDLISYGSLALATRSSNQMKKLLSDIESQGFYPSDMILEILLKNASSEKSAKKMTFILSYWMKISKIANLRMSKKVVHTVESFHNSFQEMVLKYERGENKNHLVKSKAFRWEVQNEFVEWRKFRSTYKRWLTCHSLDDSDEIHPFQQYQTRNFDK